ncbi:hypothetical protein FG386_000560 [Cryptosporidium ryanae]|uniref:uncharacterized protein n=1 Tax=Cryptosporidium ryanae TaxID=515981 RepID=UPI00351A2BFF|nr:hypothetical protein FG386_000560 [Cryptosporidium ryanae]
MFSLKSKSVRELIRDLIKAQVNREFGNLDERSESKNELIVSQIQDKLWSNIIFNNKNSSKRNKNSILEKDYMISYLDKSFSNIAISNGHADLIGDKVDKIKNSKPTTFEWQFVSLLPLVSIGNKIIKHVKCSIKDDFTLDIMFIFLRVYNAGTLYLWSDLVLIDIFYSEMTKRLYSMIKDEMKESICDVRNELPTFTSIVLVEEAMNRGITEFWKGVFTDLNICVDTFNYLYREKTLNKTLLFDNETENRVEDLLLNATEISVSVDKVADSAFNQTRKIIQDVSYDKTDFPPTESEKEASNMSKEKREATISSFMGSDSEGSNFVYECCYSTSENKVKIVEKSEYFNENELFSVSENNYSVSNKNNNKIVSYDDKSRNCEGYGIANKNYSSYNYFTKMSDMIKIGENKKTEENRFKLGHKSKTKLPVLLSRASGRSIIEYNKNRLGLSWDQQYLELNKTKKLFNESLLNVLTTERIKNCKIFFPNKNLSNGLQKNNLGYSCVSLSSIYRLFQGFPSMEFSLFPKYIRNKTLDYTDIYTFDIYKDCISVRLNEDYGELCPWMNNSGQGIRYIYHSQNHSMVNDFKNYDIASDKFTKDRNMYISNDLLSRICIFGTNVYYLKSFLEFLTVICDQINNEKIGSNDNLFIDSKLIKTNNENIISLKVIRSVLLRFIQNYFGILKTLFDQIRISNDSNKVGTSIDIQILLMILVPNINLLVKSFRLSPTNNKNVWFLPYGYSLLSNVYVYFWQLKLDKFLIEEGFFNELVSTQYRNTVNHLIRKSRNIMSDLLSSLREEVVGYEFKRLSKNIYAGINIENAMRGRIFNSNLFVLERIKLIKYITSYKSISREPMPYMLKSIENTTICDYPASEVEVYHSNDIISEFFSSEESNFKYGENKTKYESLMHYLKTYDLNFQDFYDLYHYKLENTYNFITNSKYKLKEFVNLAFIISDIIENVNDDFFMDENQALEYIKRSLKLRLKGKNNRNSIIYMENVYWVKDKSNRIHFKQLENYIESTKFAYSTEVVKFIIGLTINFKFKYEDKGVYSSDSLLECEDVVDDNETDVTFKTNINMNNKIVEINEELIITRLFQLVILLNTVIKRYLALKNIVDRIVLYIWCRRKTTDFNLYINFSNGYLYDSLSKQNMVLFWNVERKLNLIHFNLSKVLEYICVILRNLDSLNIDDINKICNYYHKWAIIKRFREKKLYSNSNSRQIGFLFSLISTFYQICLISYDITSHFNELVSNVPKRPSSFCSVKPKVSIHNGDNILPNFINTWVTNGVSNKVEKLFNMLNCLKNQIKGNNSAFDAENSHVMYYLNSNS